MSISIANQAYLTYLAKYLGVAIVAGSVVHIGTLQTDTARYFILACVGMLLMTVSNIIEAKKEGKKIDGSLVLLITTLSLATGFLSGGVQHYFDNPVYAGSLLTIGLVVSYVAFILREKYLLSKVSLAVVICIASAFAFISYFMMPFLGIPDGDHHHGTGENTENQHLYN